MKRMFALYILALLSLAPCMPVWAQSDVQSDARSGVEQGRSQLVNAEEKGLTIAMEADRRDSGWIDSESRAQMLLINRHGDTRERSMTIRALELPNDGDKRLIVFSTPPQMRGTGLLSFSHKQADDDQWLYLPAIKKVRRIATRSQSGSFLGSEFAYEDFAAQEVEKYNYRWLRDEAYDGMDCFVVESRPVDARNSGYSRRISWIDKEHYLARKIDYYDRKEDKLKTLIFSDYRQYIGKFWRADMMEMVNHQNDNRTRIIWHDYRFQNGFDERDFTHRMLKRER